MKRFFNEVCDINTPDKSGVNENKLCFPPLKVVCQAPETTVKGQVANTNKHNVYSTKNSMYLLGFEEILNTVLDCEPHIFTDDELRVIENFKALDSDERYLFVRLFMRKRNKWFRVGHLTYPDCKDVIACCKQLVLKNFFEDESLMSTEEIIEILSLDELRSLARQTKVCGKSRSEISKEIIFLSKRQSVLHCNGQQFLSFDAFGVMHKQESFLRKQLLYQCKSCVKPKKMLVDLFHRINIVYFRSSIYDEQSLTSLILARLNKFSYPNYVLSRTSNVFNCRAQCLEYVEVLELSKNLVPIFENTAASDKEALEQALNSFFEIYPIWSTYLNEDIREFWVEENRKVDTRLVRFSFSFRPGAVYTYLIHKSLNILAKSRLVEVEHEILDTLLSQNIYLVGKRGHWYNRKALLEYNFKTEDTNVLRYWKTLALSTCENGIEDKYTHLRYYFSLQRRLVRLRKCLKVSNTTELKSMKLINNNPSRLFLHGERIHNGDLSNRTVWRSKTNSAITVEELALQHYQSIGWEGIHAESSILLTLFALTFWDILFEDVPGVFQSPFQSAPLDLHTDSFYTSRESTIMKRLEEVRNGKAGLIIKDNYIREHQRKTFCVGLNWSYTCEMLLEIVDCINDNGLAQIFLALTQDYKNSSSGIPDLCLWNPSKKKFMFSEVKSDNDRLSEAQKFWISLLISSEVDVEVCHVSMHKKK